MGAKQQEQTVELLKAICIYNKAILQEVELLRKDIAKHSVEQQCALKEWMKKDLDHHFKDNKVALSAIEMIKEKANDKMRSGLLAHVGRKTNETPSNTFIE